MDQTAKLKTVLKAEIRKVIKETQVRKANNDEYKIAAEFAKTKNGSVGSIGVNDNGTINLIVDYPGGSEEAFEINSQGKEIKSVNELARVANTIKISNEAAAKAYVDANKGKWVSDMVQAVLDAGEAGITQPALAEKIGKGSQQTINPKVRELLAAGVFTQGEAGVKTAQPKSKEDVVFTSKHNDGPIKKVMAPSKDEDDEDDEEEYTDDFELSDAEDDAPEDEDTLAAKATPNKGVQTDAKKLDAVLKQMKELAAEFKTKKGTPDGDAIVAKLKDLNKEKLRLEKIVHKALGSDDEEEI